MVLKSWMIFFWIGLVAGVVGVLMILKDGGGPCSFVCIGCWIALWVIAIRAALKQNEI